MSKKNVQIPKQNKITSADLSKIKNLGQLLKKRRLSLKISLQEVQKHTKISPHYIKLIESSDYDKLSDDVYSRGFIKNYAEFLGFESKPIVDMFKSEIRTHHKHSADEIKEKSKIGLKPLHSPKIILTPKSLLFFGSLAILFLIVSYIFWQVFILASPPKLTVSNQAVQEVSANFAFVSGKVDGGADLFINDSPVLTAPDGSFREKVSLSEGANLIKITAKNKLGKAISIERTIIAKIPSSNVGKSDSQSTNDKIDGVRVTASISKQATWLIVVADGKEIFRGTILVGSTQTFEAADDLKITTGNAGSTQLILSNKLVKDKDLGFVGKDGEIKRDLEFKKDTLVK